MPGIFVGYFLQELKRRNVFRVGAAYLVVGWLILQVIETVSEPLGLPAWTEAFFIVLLSAGFPVAVIFAWAFELTPEGVKKTKEVDRTESVTADTGRKLNYAIIVALSLALAYFVIERQFLHQHSDVLATDAPTAAEVTDGTSIAVLPFVDMSPEGDQEYFSDGISEELLNVLAKIPDLRVAARTSSFQFKGQNLDIARVAEQLGVDHVLEGSVRKANNRVRITAQLIRADTGFHLWSENYDRELTDIFGIQDEISAAIVAALTQTLGLDSGTVPHVAETNPDAYNAYLLGQHLIKKRTKGDIESSVSQFQRAIDLDPQYAPAYAALALATHLLTRGRQTYGTLSLEETLSVAEPLVEKALVLDPALADGYAVRGLLLQAERRFSESLAYFDKALELNPSHNDVRSWYSSALDELGRHDESFRIMEEAYRLDPLSNLTFNNYMNQLSMRNRIADMEAVLDRYEQVDPARAAGFRGMMLDKQRRAADGVFEQLRGVDANPDNLRQKAALALKIANLGMPDEAMRLWPYDDADRMFQGIDDPDSVLTVAKKYAAQSGDPDEIYGAVAWAYFLKGDNDRALELTERYLREIPAELRASDYINWLPVYIAWLEGDTTTLDARLTPLEEQMDTSLGAGLDTGNLHWDRGVAQFMRGDRMAALGSIRTALSRDLQRRDFLEFDYRYLGWEDIPEFVEVREAYDRYVDAERAKVLAAACGEIGFNTWRPLDGTCESAGVL